MPQLHLYVSDEIAEALRERAAAKGKSLSRYLAELVTGEVEDDWPEGYFDAVIGGWRGDVLQRQAQGSTEIREEL